MMGYLRRNARRRSCAELEASLPSRCALGSDYEGGIWQIWGSGSAAVALALPAEKASALPHSPAAPYVLLALETFSTGMVGGIEKPLCSRSFTAFVASDVTPCAPLHTESTQPKPQRRLRFALQLRHSGEEQCSSCESCETSRDIARFVE